MRGIIEKAGEHKRGWLTVSTQWLAAQSFQHMRDLLAALNTLSIHLKLGLAGHPDEERREAAQQARDTLAAFLKELETLTQQAEQGDAKPMMGVDLRLRQLAKQFEAAKRDRNRFHSALFLYALPHVQQLLYSGKREDQQALIGCLQELRTLLEEHVEADTACISVALPLPMRSPCTCVCLDAASITCHQRISHTGSTP